MDTLRQEPSLSNEEMPEEELLRLAQERSLAMETFASSVEKKFQESRGKRNHKEEEWSQARSMFMPDSVAITKTGKTVFDTQYTSRKRTFNIVRPKVRIAHSQLVAMQFGAGDKNWMMTKSKFAEPQQAITDPDMAMRRMENIIADQLDRCNYGREVRESMLDMCVLGTGILKGPSNCGKMKKTWIPQQMEDGRIIHVPSLSPEYVPTIKRVDPWLFFADPTVPKADQAEWAIEVHPYSKKDLTKLKSHPKFFAEVIDEVLMDDPKDWWFSNIIDYTNTANYEIFRNKYTVFEYNGIASTDCACKISPEIESNNPTMWVQAFVCQGKVIYFDTFDLETIDSIPYAVGNWEPDPSSMYGFGIPITMQPQQLVINGIYDVLVENAKLSSGPQIVVNTAHVEPEDDGSYDIRPFKVWAAKEYGIDVQKIFQQFRVESNQQDLASIMEMARAFADEESGIPLIQGGLESPEMGNSATGTALLMKASTSVLNLKSQEWDDQVTKNLIQWMYEWNMTYHSDHTAKGDFEADVTTPTSMIRKNIELQNLEKLSVEIAQNPQLAAEVNPTALTRARFSAMMLPPDQFLKTDEEKQAEAEAMANQPDPAMMEMQIKDREVAVNEQKLEIEREKLAWESSRGQQRDMWEHEERMANTVARREENQAQLMGKQIEKEIELIRMAADQEVAMAELAQRYQIATLNDETKKVLSSMELDLRGRAQNLKEIEMVYAAKKGKGI